MKISTKGRIAAGAALATIGLIAAAIWWANTEVEDAGRQRQWTTDIAKGLSELRLVSFDYLLSHQARALQQAGTVADRLDRLIVSDRFLDPEPARILAELQERNVITRRLFDDILTMTAQGLIEGPDSLSNRRSEAQLASRLLILQQESHADAFMLADYSTERINRAQQRVVSVIAAGFGLLIALMATTAWLVSRDVLKPIARLEQATREIAAGNWGFELHLGGNDEIGELARNFDVMTQSLRNSFAQIERSNLELAALNREIEAFSYSVSHDLRGPLRSMDGFAMALLEDYAGRLDAEGEDALRRIRAASQRMGRLIDDLLGLSRVTRVELAVQSVQLSAMAREIAESLAQQQPQRRVQWVIDEGMTVQADKALTHIAMQNLLENAWKFTGKTERPVIRVGALEEEGNCNYFVADNGAGFDMAYADRLFGAFQRMHQEREFPGTGIGLAIVQRVFRRHGGRIWAEAKPGSGATFFFRFKETPGRPPVSLPTSGALARSDRSGGTLEETGHA